MKSGVAVGFQNPPQWRVPWERTYNETLEYVQLAEQLGIDQVWLPEHHFSDDGFCPSLLTAAAAIASRTERIRIGTKILILPFHDPVRLAEDIAVVDILSGGRIEVGAASGYRKAEFDAFGIAHRERGARMREGLEILVRALSGEEFTYAGKFHRYGSLRIMPPPLQRPVPLWLGGRTRPALRRAAEYGAKLALADFDVEACQNDIKVYTEALIEFGRAPEDHGICAVASVFVDRDPERAWAVAGPHLLYQHNQWLGWFNEVQDRPSDTGMLTNVSQLRGAAALVGTPEQVAEGIRSFRAQVPFTHFSFFGLLPGMSLEAAAPSLELISQEVLPSLRADPVRKS
jgi:alkanesulfonate monooxygenase SsuD/methylene tetrahydromethanopterin reductase-like flavin-dependent oxidoreductase (luciferase family)